jgi:heme/copper-type cytochrome/quinol oxidase subunit 1
MLIVLLIIFAGIILYEVPKMKQKKLNRELVLFSVILLIGFTLSMLQLYNVKLPSPTREINIFIRNTLNLSYENFSQKAK